MDRENINLEQLEMKKQYIVESAKEPTETSEGLEIEFIISTGSVDRDNDTLNVKGWELENYKKNPVVLWAHDRARPPVAKSIDIRVENEKLISKALFMPKDLSAFAYSVGQMYAKGFLNAVSVGFKGIVANLSNDKNRPHGIDFIRQELREYSCCPIPSNPEALALIKSDGIDPKPLIDWAVEILDTTKNVIEKDRVEKIYQILQPKAITSVVSEKEKALFLCKKQIQINENRRKLL